MRVGPVIRNIWRFSGAQKIYYKGRVKIGNALSLVPAEQLDISGHQNFDAVTEPTSAEVIAMNVSENLADGTLTAGKYYYNVQFVTDDGECGSYISEPNQPSITVSANSSVDVTGIPISDDPRVTGRWVMRTSPGGLYYRSYRLKLINDNTTTTYKDDGSDSIDTNYSHYRNPNTTAGKIKIDGTDAVVVQNFNTSVGFAAHGNITSGNSSVAVGRSALQNATTASENTALGYSALSGHTTGGANVAIGFTSMGGMTAPSKNVAIGSLALRSSGVTVITGNVAIGYRNTNNPVTNSNYNTCIGYQAGYGLGNAAIAVNNVIIGAHSAKMTLDNGSSNILIGYNIDTPAADTSDHLNIGGTLFGDLANNRIGINNNTPLATLDVDGDTRLGDRTTNYSEFSATGDQTFVGSSGLPFGEIYVVAATDTITITTAGQANKVQITSFDTDGASNNMTPDHTNDHITVVKAGYYLCTISLHIESAGAGGADIFGFSVYKNNGTVEFPNCHAHRQLSGGGGDVGSVSISGIIDLAVSDTIELWTWNEDSTDNLVVQDVTMSLVQIGGT